MNEPQSSGTGPEATEQSFSADQKVEAPTTVPEASTNEALLSPEDEQAPESPERVHETKAALDKLVEVAGQYAHNFSRDVRRVEYDFDPRAIDPENRQMGAMVEKNVSVPTGAEGLKTIYLWTFADEHPGAAYRLSLSFDPGKGDGSPRSPHLLLSGEWPRFRGYQLTGNAIAAQAQGRRIQDFLYAPGADTVPVREADFSYLAWYRPEGVETAYEATAEQMDVMLDLLARATVMETVNKQGPKAVDLVPELANLVKP